MKSLWTALGRPALARVTGSRQRRKRSEQDKAERERVRQQQKAELLARRVEQVATKRQIERERALRKQEEEAQVEHERLAREATAANAYENYLQVRAWAGRIRAANGVAAVQLTATERQVIAALAHIWDAPPEIIANLRQWCEPISGVGVADYETTNSDHAARLKHDLYVLRRLVGRELFVEEPPVLGGFGYVRRGERYNEETVKFFNVLVALQDAAILAECRHATQRRLVWEIGGGWGGFAYQFKTICPNVTYLITGIPELLIVSAVYLMAAFPGARCRFYDGASGADVWRGWEAVDFVFAPEAALPDIGPPRLDLTLDVMALRNMGTDRVWSHVQRSFDAGSRYFYSLLPDRERRSADERPAVWSGIERWYWPHPIPPRGEVDDAIVAVNPGAMPDSDYAHLIGWRRIRA
jgi:hypothetical protein